MEKWLDVAEEGDIPSGQWITFDTGIEEIIVVNVDNKYYAIQDICTHDFGDLSSGELDGDEMVCPRHGARFCLKTGEATCPPAYEPVETFPVRVEQGKIQVLVKE